MRVQLQNVSFATFVERVFDHPPPAGDAEPWHFGRVRFEVEPTQQLQHIGELFRGAGTLATYGLSNAQIELGLWCVLGGAHNWSFVSLLWDSSLPVALRTDAVAGLFQLYDQLLATAPHESIDFGHPYQPPRRFQGIDYMAFALVVEAIRPSSSLPRDRARMRAGLLCVGGRLLDHPAPVAQYSGLHGLGHLRTKKRTDVIDRYLARPSVQGASREYALNARAGTIL